jgi:hypothetical protein
LYITGRWAEETLNLPQALNKSFSKSDRAKVFVGEKFEREEGGKNITVDDLMITAIVGLGAKIDPKSSHESYGEYLKRRKLIPANTLALH